MSKIYKGKIWEILNFLYDGFSKKEILEQGYNLQTYKTARKRYLKQVREGNEKMLNLIQKQ